MAHDGNDERPTKRQRCNKENDEQKESSASFLDWKVFNDPIHGHIEIHPLCVKIVDTPQFQRLRYLKQLGACYYVYPGATHNRFEHSIGVSFLAGEMVTRFQHQQPDLGITDVDVICVKIAGLCHDLGHGPFSHLYDGTFIPLVEPESKWTHEQASVDMLTHLIQENNLREEFEKYDICDNDIEFIKEMITGPPKDRKTYVGRPDKVYLYEIVANKRNAIDVDKWDYFARDCYMLGMKNNFDHIRCMRFMRVISDEEGIQQICLRDKEDGNLYDMFHTRNALHRRAYQHAVAHAVEAMIVDAMVIANDHIKIPGENNKMRTLKECKNDMFAYTKLSDNIFHSIMLSTQPELKEARDIVDRIQKRELYRCIGQTRPPQKLKKGEEDQLLQEIAAYDSENKLESNCLLLKYVNFDYGMKDKNPVDNVRFYSKSKPDEARKVRKEQVSQLLPETFHEQVIRIFCKDRNVKVIGAARKAFEVWCNLHGYDAMTNRWELTPAKSKEMTSSDIASVDDNSVNKINKTKKALFDSPKSCV